MYRNLRVFRIESRQDVRQYERTPERRQPQGDLAGGEIGNIPQLILQIVADGDYLVRGFEDTFSRFGGPHPRRGAHEQ